MTATPASVADLLTELARHGIELQAHGEQLRYRPRSAMTPELVEQVKSCKSELLAVLRTDGVGNAPEPEPEVDIPKRPPDRLGYVTELAYKRGQWSWQHRWMDEADRAWLAYHEE